MAPCVARSAHKFILFLLPSCYLAAFVRRTEITHDV
jgi:hypothetical protein